MVSNGISNLFSWKWLRPVNLSFIEFLRWIRSYGIHWIPSFVAFPLFLLSCNKTEREEEEEDFFGTSKEGGKYEEEEEEDYDDDI